MPRCATDPGASTPVGGGAVFKYATGTLEVRVRRAPGSRDTAFNVYSLAFDLNTSGTSVLSTTIESTATLAFNAPTAATLTGCASATPSYVGPIITAATYTVYQYTATSCSEDATLSLSATATATNTVTGESRILGATGSGGASSSGSNFSGWTKQTAFITSGSHNGNFGGLSGADSFCSVAGVAGTHTSALPGTWKAIMSSTTSSAASRLTLSSSLPLKTSSSATILTFADQLWSGSLLQPILDDENGNPQVTATPFTGTLSNGTANSSMTCTNWTVANGAAAGVGTSTATDSSWAYDNTAVAQCIGTAQVYCINVP